MFFLPDEIEWLDTQIDDLPASTTRRLKPTEAKVYRLLCSHRRHAYRVTFAKSKKQKPIEEVIVEQSGLNIRTVQNAFSALARKAWIKRHVHYIELLVGDFSSIDRLHKLIPMPEWALSEKKIDGRGRPPFERQKTEADAEIETDDFSSETDAAQSENPVYFAPDGENNENSFAPIGENKDDCFSPDSENKLVFFPQLVQNIHQVVKKNDGINKELILQSGNAKAGTETDFQNSFFSSAEREENAANKKEENNNNAAQNFDSLVKEGMGYLEFLVGKIPDLKVQETELREMLSENIPLETIKLCLSANKTECMRQIKAGGDGWRVSYKVIRPKIRVFFDAMNFTDDELSDEQNNTRQKTRGEQSIGETNALVRELIARGNAAAGGGNLSGESDSDGRENDALGESPGTLNHRMRG